MEGIWQTCKDLEETVWINVSDPEETVCWGSELTSDKKLLNQLGQYTSVNQRNTVEHIWHESVWVEEILKPCYIFEIFSNSVLPEWL